MTSKHYSSLKESLLLTYDLAFKSLSEILHNHLNDFYGCNECKNVHVKWKNSIWYYKYKLEKAKRKHNNILTVGNEIIGNFLF